MSRFHIGLGGTLIALLSACSVDDRTLTQAVSAAGGGGASSDLDSGSMGGEGGEGGSALPSLPVCTFGKDPAADCYTLVNNPGFATDTSGWDAEMPSISMSWSSQDATGDSASGSLSVESTLYGTADGVGIRGASQCLQTAPGNAYGFAGDIFIPDGQGAGSDGGTYDATAALSIIFYEMSDCTGYSAANFTSDIASEPGKWGHHAGRAVAPNNAASMVVRLVTLKNFREFEFKALFDNVLVKAE